MIEAVPKVKRLMKLDAGMLGQLKDVEQKLAAKEAKALEDAVPDGHPLKGEIEKQKALLGGDLSGLPAGHPLLRALQTAKDTYEARKVEEEKVEAKAQKEAPDEEAAKLRKAKRLEEVEARRKRYNEEEQQADEMRDASKEVNGKLDVVLSSVRELWQIMERNEEVLSRTQMGKARVMRLKRLVFATERGLSETRMGRI
jgi:hypothetical protein